MNLRRTCYFLAFACLFVTLLSAQVPVAISPVSRQQFFNSSGSPLAFGCVFSYQSGTTTSLATYTDYTGTVTNANPLILNAGGFVGTGGIWLQAGQAYRLVVKSSGGTNCASGSTISTVDGIGGGLTLLTTLVTCNTTCSFPIASQIQLFKVNLTGNAVANPLTAVGILSPAIVIFQITQDSAGGHTFTWPANSVGGATVDTGINEVTEQMFVWNGTNATAIGPGVSGNGPELRTGDIFDSALAALSAVCTDANKKLIAGAGCNSVFAVTYNGQTVNPGGSGNVNAGAADGSVAINQGNGNAITGVTLGDDQILIGNAGAGVDPSASTLPTCASTQEYLSYSGTPPLTCNSRGYTKIQAATFCASGCTVTMTPCTTGTGDYNTCTDTLTWPTTMTVTTYSPVCSGIDPEDGSGTDKTDALLHIRSWTATTITVQAVNIVGEGSGIQFQKYSCHAITP